MLIMSSYTWLLWLVFVCWCCMSSTKGDVYFGEDEGNSGEKPPVDSGEKPPVNHRAGCVPQCKNYGKCINNKCSCSTGFYGPVCEHKSGGLCTDEDLRDTDPILLITFGNGSNQYSTKKPANFHFSTTYEQVFEPTTADGRFSLINSIHDDFGGSWHTGATDHTGDKGGYMFLVNADFKAGEFYRGTVKNLCVGQLYEFSVYLANICKPDKCEIKPNVKFQVRTTVGNHLLAELNSGNVLEHNTLTWKKYGLSFTAKTNSVVLLMISNAAGGMGNDLALDDIALRVCGAGKSGFCPSDD
ncbi:unnamed protein product [Adineta steineri]|uniref:EGF-like domain-containing protein n=2 Tax=Adineta steineri TaxID=433720 RepID=A0A813QJ45_9BILA|nr:unnamed protein product [Adineta steineri]